MTRSERNALAAAGRGAKYLDKKLGSGWRRKIKRRRLAMGSGGFDTNDKSSCGCILAQLAPDDDHYGFRSYSDGCTMVGVAAGSPRARTLGFEEGTWHTLDAYDTLTKAWRQVLREGVRA